MVYVISINIAIQIQNLCFLLVLEKNGLVSIQYISIKIKQLIHNSSVPKNYVKTLTQSIRFTVLSFFNSYNVSSETLNKLSLTGSKRKRVLSISGGLNVNIILTDSIIINLDAIARQDIAITGKGWSLKRGFK